MRIESKSGTDAGYVDRCARMAAAKQATAAHCKELAAKRAAGGAKAGHGLVGGVHQEALMEAVRQEGVEVLSGAAKGWWDDQKRMNPWMCADGVVPDGNSWNGHRGRHGVVKERMRAGRWEHWDGRSGCWVPGEISKRKGVL